MARVICFFNPKGGVGTTFISLNVAVVLANMGNRVLALDASLPISGDLCRLIGVFPSRSFLDFYYRWEDMDRVEARAMRVIDNYVVSHSSGLYCLPSINSPEEVTLLEKIDPRPFLQMLSKHFDYIIIDAGHNFYSFLAKLLDEVNLILEPVVPDLLSVYQAKEGFNITQGLFFPKQIVKLVVNRAESRGGVGLKEIRTVLPLDVVAQIPSEGRPVGESVNFGVPVVLYEPNCRVSQALKSFAQVLVDNESLYVEKKTIKDIKFTERDLPSVSALVSFWQEYGFEAQAEKGEDIDEVILLKKRVHTKLLERIELRRYDFLAVDPRQRAEIRRKTELIIGEIISEEAKGVIEDYETRAKLIKEIVDEALGFGPLEDLLRDPDVTDIIVNNKDQIYVEKFGKLHRVEDKKFISNEQVIQIIERIIAPLGRRIDESVPMVDARLPDGSRVNAIIPPLALNGPMLTIRKFSKERYTVEDLISFGSLSKEMAEFLKACVVARKNIIVSGGTGSGKTTVLNAFSQFIPGNERIITIEDAAELRLHQEHWARLESRPPNIEGKGEITIRDLFRNTLRMRPDRIIIGECRGVEALDMLQAMNTGHDGSLTTIHANSTQDVVARLDSMILMSGVELPIRAIREMVASAIDIIVHTARLSDGSRKVVQITELVGLESDMMTISMRDVFVFLQKEIDERGNVIGDFTATGYIPSFYNDLVRRRLNVSKEMFTPKPIFYEVSKQKKRIPGVE